MPTRSTNWNSHGPGTGMEFPWPGSAMIGTWSEAWLASSDPLDKAEYKDAIETVLDRWESLRDPTTGRLAPSTTYQDYVWQEGYMKAANVIDAWADLIEPHDAVLAEMMRDYGRNNDAEFFTEAEERLDVKGNAIVMSYLRSTGDFDPNRLDILGGPWQDR
jgi:hypothetical protein